jgi:hypothetical protein
MSTVHVRFGSKADIEARPFDVRFTPKSGHWRSEFRGLLCAKSGREQVQQKSAMERQVVASPHDGVSYDTLPVDLATGKTLIESVKRCGASPRLNRQPGFLCAFAVRPSHASKAKTQNRLRSGSSDLHQRCPCYCKSTAW